MAIHASFKASDNVGWAWHVLAKSSLAAPYSMASTASAINSPALGPIIWNPKILSVFLSASTFTNPGYSSFVFALEFAKKGNFPFVYSIPSPFNYSSVLPTEATSGCVYMTPGIAS